MVVDLKIHSAPASRRAEWCIHMAFTPRNLEVYHLSNHFLIYLYTVLGAELIFSDFYFAINEVYFPP